MKELKINVPEGYEIDKDKSTFENIVFKKKELPNSWEGLVSVYGFRLDPEVKTTEGIFFTKNRYDRLLFKTKEQANASLALAQLSQLRDVYRDGWEPDWATRFTEKYCIYFQSGKLVIFESYFNEFFLSFQDRKTAELFLENFRDLIEQAKPLMS